jgi:hypothetical protein
MIVNTRGKKGQMFIVTVVFLVGVIFIVQQILLQYSYIDVQSSYKETDFHLMKSVEDVATQAVTVASTCTEAEKNLEESLLFLGEQTIGGYSLDVSYEVNCSNWGNTYPSPGPVSATIKITSEKTETKTDLIIYSEGSMPCSCDDWVNIGCGSAQGCSDGYMRRTRTCAPSLCQAESQCVADQITCGALQCRITGFGLPCIGSEIDVLHISTLSNAHAELPTLSNYDYKVCCMGPGSLGNDCSAGVNTAFLQLSSSTNAHVEQVGQPFYSTDACFSGVPVTCGYTTNPSETCDDVQAGSACLVSMSGLVNAHVAECTGAGYTTKVCCWIT